jgi:germination protein M
LKDGILNIDFSNEFLTYNKDLEEKILESLTWSVLDFKEIKGLTISVDGNELKKMPLNGFVLPNVLDKSIGINKYHDMINKCIDCSSVIVVYSKVINDKEYYIPVTRNVTNNDNFEFVEAYNMEVSVLSGLNKVYDLSNLNDLKVEDNILKVNVSNEYLIEENIINENIYNLWSVVSYFNDYEYVVNFFVDGESVMVNGYQSLEKEVGLININEVKI